MDLLQQDSIKHILIGALWVSCGIWSMLIAQRKRMDRFTALLTGVIFGFLAVLYYMLADREKSPRESNPSVLYALVAILIAVMICGTIVIVNK